jgi:hypothetical protein
LFTILPASDTAVAAYQPKTSPFRHQVTLIDNGAFVGIRVMGRARPVFVMHQGSFGQSVNPVTDSDRPDAIVVILVPELPEVFVEGAEVDSNPGSHPQAITADQIHLSRSFQWAREQLTPVVSDEDIVTSYPRDGNVRPLHEQFRERLVPARRDLYVVIKKQD